MARNGADVSHSHTFRTLLEKADRKYGRVRDLPTYGKPSRYLQKVFKAYMKVWRYQQENRSELVESGLQRWEIGEIASRIGQLYYGQYMRTSETRFLLEAFVFYEAILNRRYFENNTNTSTVVSGSRMDLGGRMKELRFYARFLLVALILNRSHLVALLVDRFQSLLQHSTATFPENHFKEWRLVVQEILRFVHADKPFPNARPLRYSAALDRHSDSLPYVARFHAKKVLKLHDAVLTSYHKNEVKFAELTLDTFRMLQCLEWEPSASFYQKHDTHSTANGFLKEYSATSGLIGLNLASDLTDDSTLAPNPKKAILYRPNSTHLLAVIAAICEELPPESIMLIYISSLSGNTGTSSAECTGGSRRFSKSKSLLSMSNDQNSSPRRDHKKEYLSNYYDTFLSLNPRGSGGSNIVYPGDLLPFTRRPIFLVIDSDNSRAFKVIHGAERGEPSALLLSPSLSSFKSPSNGDRTANGSQFTLFLTAPLQAFCQVVGLSASDRDEEVYDEAEYIIANAIAKWEVMLCSSIKVDLVWAQVLPDPFLRRIILRFIFCRAVLHLFHPVESRDPYLPDCQPPLPDFVSPDAETVESNIYRLADHLRVSECFENT